MSAHAAWRAALVIGGAGLFAAPLFLLDTPEADALPMYAQRSGRTCGNCHVSPTLEDPDGWDNPELMDRKCTLSCVACHVNPTGGGLRNSSGRYFGQSTLSVVHTQDRSYSDHHREILSSDTLWKLQQWLDEPASKEDPEDRHIPSDWEEVQAGIGEGQRGKWTAVGEPLGHPGVMSFWDGRYDDLNADPLFQYGADLRAAYWSGTDSFFPMQMDVGAAVHPVEHLVVMGTVAAQRRDAENPGSPVFARNAFVMLNELPGMSWVKAGIFMPSFGTYIDDHTSFTRAWFEQDISRSEDMVAGVEIGTAPNYPFASLSAFQTEGGGGWGSALNLGWRDLGWSLTGHAMVKQRGALGRGDLYAAGLGWGFNPAYYWEKIPITTMGEISVGRTDTPAGSETYVAVMHEAWWILRNGVNLRGKIDTGIRALGEPGATQRRYGLGLDMSPVPGLTFTAMGRALFAPGSSRPQPDLFVQSHIWF